MTGDKCPVTGAPHPRGLCVNAVDKGVSERFGVKAVDEGLTALDEGGNGGWAEGSVWEMKGEQKWAAGLWRDEMVAGEIRRARERSINPNVRVEDSRRGKRGTTGRRDG